MPSLEDTAVAAWARERDLVPVIAHASRHSSSAEGRAAADEGFAKLGTLLDVAHAADAARLTAVLRTEPVMTDLRAMLALLEPAQVLRLSAWLADTGLPERSAVLDALFAPDPSGLGQALRATLQSQHRRALLASIFNSDRVQALRRACRTIAKETT